MNIHQDVAVVKHSEGEVTYTQRRRNRGAEGAGGAVAPHF